MARHSGKRSRNSEALGSDVDGSGNQAEGARAADKKEEEEEGGGGMLKTMKADAEADSPARVRVLWSQGEKLKHEEKMTSGAGSPVRVRALCERKHEDNWIGEAGSLGKARVLCRQEEEEEKQKQKHKDNRIILAMVHLLTMASKPHLPSWGCWKAAMASFRAIQRFLSSSNAPLPNFVMQGLLAGMPVLLCYKQKSVAIQSAALLGAMALNSYQSTLQIVNDKMVLKRLLNLLTVMDTETLIEACHSVANLATSIPGQTALCDIGAVEKLMHLLSLTAGSIASSFGTKKIDGLDNCAGESHDMGQNQVALLSEILEAVDVLTCNIFCESLVRIPVGLRTSILKSLQVLWKRLRDQSHPLLHGDSIRVLSKMIVWLAMEQQDFEGVDGSHKKLVKCLFGGLEVDFEHFWDEHWERSPFLMEEGVDGGETRANLFGKAWRAGGGSFVLKELLTRSLACPLFSSDELEASQVYEEIEEKLGKPLIFGQDIRLVKAACTELCSMQAVKEEDYQEIASGACTKKGVSMYADVPTCVDAYESGYTIALRGMEFRCPQVAAMTEALAVCFGQATVGANLYMTPPDAQGFKAHVDDHCVFVWQLTGSKAWKVWSPKSDLPRLYSQNGKLEKNHTDEGDAWGILLKEGSVFYIPRGFPHAATTKMQTHKLERPLRSCYGCSKTSETYTESSGDSGRSLQSDTTLNGIFMADVKNEECLISKESKWHFELSSPIALAGTDAIVPSGGNCMKKWKDCHWISGGDTTQSIHITFGVEVEPPFDWEGLVHMSLHCWAEQQNWEDIVGRNEQVAGACQASIKRLSELYTGLLHVAVRNCGDRCSEYRKACLVAAQPLHQETHNFSRLESFFKTLMENVAQTAYFKAALDIVLTAIDTSEGTSLDWMCWLRHLSGKQEHDFWTAPVVSFCDRLTDHGLAESLEDMEVKFLRAKDSFVSHASFPEACDLFVALLHKYRSIRKRFVNGMLALQI